MAKDNEIGKNKNPQKSEKVLELNYQGFSYRKICDFDVQCTENVNKNTINGICGNDEEKNEQFKCFCNNALLKTFINVEKKLSSKTIRDDSLYIARGTARKNDRISIFWDNNSDIEPENHTIHSKINGVVGALTYEFTDKFNLRMSLNGKNLSVSDQFNKVRVNVEIYSSMDEKDKITEDNKQESVHSYFTATMLTYGKINSLNDDVPCGMDNLFDFLLIDLFAKELEKACKKGYFRTYRQFYGNDDRVKGSIDVTRHIRLNTGLQNGKIAYRYKENTINNYLDILMLKTYRYVKKRYPEIVNRKIDENENLHSLFQSLQYELDEQAISLHTAIAKNMKPISHPYFSEYESVRKICLRILRKQGLSIFESNRGTIGGFIYYFPDLWEDYLERKLKDIIYRNSKFEGYSVESQKSEGFLSKYNQENEYLWESRPDFVFMKNNKYKMMLDAKMIPGMERMLKDEPNTQKDYSDAVNKCIRDMVVFGLKNTGVVFPVRYDKKTDEMDDDLLKEELEDIWYSKSRKVIKKRNTSKFYFYVVPFVLPKSSGYNSYFGWKKQFNRFERIYSEQMEKILEEVLG